MNKIQKFLLFILLVETLILPFVVHYHNQAHDIGNQSDEVKIESDVKYQSAEDGSLPGDDTYASGYASLQSLIDNEGISGLYDHKASFKVTHYCGCSKCCGKWNSGSENDAVGAAGTKLIPYSSVAVDPSVIPFGTELHDENGNTYIAQDTGSAIKGNRIDLFVGNHSKAIKLGVKEIVLYW